MNNSSAILESSQSSTSQAQAYKSLNELDLELQQYWQMMASSWGMEKEIPADWWKYFSHNINIRDFQKYYGFQGTNGLTNEQVQQRLQFEEMKIDQELKKYKLQDKGRYRERWLFLLLIVYKFAMIMAALLFFVVFWYQREDYPILIAGLFLIASFIFFCASESIPERRRENFERIGLMKLIPTECLVIRDGNKMKIKSTELVQGDVLDLQKGVQVAADCRVLNYYQKQQQRTLIIKSPYLFKERRSDMQCTDPLSQLISKNVIPQGSIIVGGLGQAVVLHSVVNSRLCILAQKQQIFAELKYYHRDYQKNFIIRLYYYLTIVATIGLLLSIAFALIQKYVRNQTDIQTLHITAVTIVAFLPTGLLTACEMGIKYFFPRKGIKNESNQYCFSFDSRLSTLFLLSDGLIKGKPWNYELNGDTSPRGQTNENDQTRKQSQFNVSQSSNVSNGLEQSYVTLLADIKYLISEQTNLKTLWISQLEVEIDSKLGWVGMNVLNGTDQTLQHLYSCFLATQSESTRTQDKEICRFFNNLPNKIHFNRLSSIIARNEKGNCVSIQEDWLRLDVTLQIVQERSEGGDFVVYVRGNPQKIWSACTSIYKNGKMYQKTKQTDKKFERIMDNVAARTENGIAFAKKVLRESYNGNFIDEKGRLQIPLCGFCFISLATFSINVHPEAHDALELVSQSGINLILFTTQERAVTEQLAIKLGLTLKLEQFNDQKEQRDDRVTLRQQEQFEEQFSEDRMDIASEISSQDEDENNQQGSARIQEVEQYFTSKQSQSNAQDIYDLNADEIESEKNNKYVVQKRNTKQFDSIYLSENLQFDSNNKETQKSRRNSKRFDDLDCSQNYPNSSKGNGQDNIRNCILRNSILDELIPFKSAAFNIDADNCTGKQLSRYRRQSLQQGYLKLKQRQIRCDLKIHKTSPHIELICNADLSSRQCMVNQLNSQGIKSWYLAGTLSEFQAFNPASVILAAPYSESQQDTQNLNGLLSAADARLTTNPHSTMIHSAVYLIQVVNSLSSRLRQAYYFVSVTHTASFMPLLFNICFSIPLMISPILMLLLSSLVNLAPVLAIFKFKYTQIESFRISSKNRKVIHARLIHYSIFVMGVIATAAGILAFVFSMNRFGFPVWSLPYLVDQEIFVPQIQNRQLQDNGTDFFPRFLESMNIEAGTVITPLMPFWNPKIMNNENNNCKKDLDTFKPRQANIDWNNSTVSKLDLRSQFVYCDQQTNQWKTSITWSPCQPGEFANSNNSICYTTTALAYSQTSYFLGLFFFQFLHLFTAHSLSYSMFLHRFNSFSLLALLISFIIALMIVQIPGVQLILGTRSVSFWLWGIPSMVIAVFASIHEEFRKLFMRNSKWCRRISIK